VDVDRDVSRPSPAPVRRRPAWRWWPLQLLRFAAALIITELVVVVLAGALLSALGYRASVVRSGSMRPTLGVGALVVSRPATPLELHRGELVTFSSHSFGGASVTHRVVSVTRLGDRVRVVTKGDANLVPEKWELPVDGRVGLAVFHVNEVGRLLLVLGDRWVRITLIVVAAALTLRLLLGWIWRAPPAPTSAVGDPPDDGVGNHEVLPPHADALEDERSVGWWFGRAGDDGAHGHEPARRHRALSHR